LRVSRSHPFPSPRTREAGGRAEAGRGRDEGSHWATSRGDRSGLVRVVRARDRRGRFGTPGLLGHWNVGAKPQRIAHSVAAQLRQHGPPVPVMGALPENAFCTKTRRAVTRRRGAASRLTTGARFCRSVAAPRWPNRPSCRVVLALAEIVSDQDALLQGAELHHFSSARSNGRGGAYGVDAPRPHPRRSFGWSSRVVSRPSERCVPRSRR
jgi:hypothetical protein